MQSQSPWIDGALYPEIDPPEDLVDEADKADFLSRLCAAWDFGTLPDPGLVAQVRKPEWRDAVDGCRLLTSPVYHLLRKWHNLPVLPYLGQKIPMIRDDPSLAYI